MQNQAQKKLPPDLPLVVKHSPRARSIRLSINPDATVRLTLPPLISESDGLAFLESKRTWVEKHLSKLPTQQDPFHYLQSNPILAGYSNSDRLTLTPKTLRRYQYNYDWNTQSLRIHFDPSADPKTQTDQVLRQLQFFAKAVLPLRLADCAHLANAHYNAVSVRSNKNRWGSCSSDGSISLNWKLILLPHHLCDHILLHELAHRTHMDHSPRFWSLLESYDPNTPAHRKELRSIGRTILAIFNT